MADIVSGTRAGLLHLAALVKDLMRFAAANSVVHYTGTAWPSRPTNAVGPVRYVSTKHVNAPKPPDAIFGDIWTRHPDATPGPI